MRCVNLEEKVTVEFYDQEHEEWGLKEATIEDVLDSVCSTQYTEIEAEPVYHSTRKDENGVTFVYGKNGWERKEE